MADLGFLTGDQEKEFANFLDELVDFSKFDGFVFKIIELLDGKIFLAGISYLDDTLGDKISPELKPLVGDFALACLGGEGDEIAETGTTLLNTLIDIPNITEENEAIMISGVLQAIVAVVLNFINKEEEIVE